MEVSVTPRVLSLSWVSAGAAPGVGSKVTQPMRGKNASTQLWASVSATRKLVLDEVRPPVAKPAATRLGMPSIRSISAIAPENCWQ
jgi:hypothetical protein